MQGSAPTHVNSILFTEDKLPTDWAFTEGGSWSWCTCAISHSNLWEKSKMTDVCSQNGRGFLEPITINSEPHSVSTGGQKLGAGWLKMEVLLLWSQWMPSWRVNLRYRIINTITDFLRHLRPSATFIKDEELKNVQNQFVISQWCIHTRSPTPVHRMYGRPRGVPAGILLYPGVGVVVRELRWLGQPGNEWIHGDE